MKYEDIQERAQILLDEIEYQMERSEGLDNPDLLDGFKAAFCLAKRDLQLYKRSFYDVGLDIDLKSAEAIWEEFSFLLPGYKGLTLPEKETLREAQMRLSY
jgi:hypothetical protein